MKAKKRQKVHVITMGCAKNAVDSEKLMAQIRLNDIELADSVEEADIAVINTCGFIDAAKEESVDTIIENVKRKGKGKLRKVYVMGCLSERYREDLIREIPEVDAFFGSDEAPAVLRELGADFKYDLVGERVLTTPPHLAYLKISEGCDNPCSFCAIPLMRGTHKSRPFDEILLEAKKLASRGVRELVMIGQDTTYYGLDLQGARLLSDLLERVADTEGIEWVRLMYAYPAKFPLDVLDVLARHPHVCKYLDIPVQHVADDVLRSMRRGISQRALRELLDEIRSRVPGIVLRTTLIVGYPAEGEREFEELLRFVEDVQFERLGVFTYSPEEGTGAFPLGDPVSKTEKERRRECIMKAQRDISQERNEKLIGSTRKVIIDRIEGSLAIGRTEGDAPEIDNEVQVTSVDPLIPGSFYDVEIVDAYEYDLVGRARQ